MAGSVIDEYVAGASLTELASAYELPISQVRTLVKHAGVLRSRSEGVRLAASKGKLGGGLRGKKRVFTDQHKENIRTARLKWGEENAIGVSVKPNGYVEHTRGENKGRGVHRTVVEQKLGRKLLRSEHVHHVDEIRSNNEDGNLSMLPISDHLRLHRLQEITAGKIRERDEHGRFR